MTTSDPFGGLLAALALNALADRMTAMVTVATDGMLISGMLISARAFYAGIADASAAYGDIGGVQLSARLQTSLDNAPTVPPDHIFPVDARPETLYFSGAACWSGGKRIDLGFWAVRYASVTGWSVGTLAEPA